MSSGLYRVYWRFGNRKKWAFEAAFVSKCDANTWILSELNGYGGFDLHYKIMHNGKKVWTNV